MRGARAIHGPARDLSSLVCRPATAEFVGVPPHPFLPPFAGLLPSMAASRQTPAPRPLAGYSLRGRHRVGHGPIAGPRLARKVGSFRRRPSVRAGRAYCGGDRSLPRRLASLHSGETPNTDRPIGPHKHSLRPKKGGAGGGFRLGTLEERAYHGRSTLGDAQ